MTDENQDEIEEFPQKVQVVVKKEDKSEDTKVFEKMRKEFIERMATKGITFSEQQIPTFEHLDNLINLSVALLERQKQKEIQQQPQPSGIAPLEGQYGRSSYPMEDIPLEMREFDSQEQMIQYLNELSKKDEHPDQKEAKKILSQLAKKVLKQKDVTMEFQGKIAGKKERKRTSKEWVKKE